MDYASQILFAVLLAIPVACIAWTFTQEEIFKEVRESLKAYQRRHPYSLWRQKMAYLPTCPYCFSHYVAGAFVALFRFPMLTNDWRGYVVSLFTLVLVANFYMTLYNLLRVALRRWKALADQAEADRVEKADSARKAVEIEHLPPVRIHNGHRRPVPSRNGHGVKGVYAEAR